MSHQQWSRSWIVWGIGTGRVRDSFWEGLVEALEREVEVMLEEEEEWEVLIEVADIFRFRDFKSISSISTSSVCISTDIDCVDEEEDKDEFGLTIEKDLEGGVERITSRKVVILPEAWEREVVEGRGCQ